MIELTFCNETRHGAEKESVSQARRVRGPTLMALCFVAEPHEIGYVPGQRRALLGISFLAFLLAAMLLADAEVGKDLT
jgi:hypothetical protein